MSREMNLDLVRFLKMVRIDADLETARGMAVEQVAIEKVADKSQALQTSALKYTKYKKLLRDLLKEQVRDENTDHSAR
jgi:hypothetical protein